MARIDELTARTTGDAPAPGTSAGPAMPAVPPDGVESPGGAAPTDRPA